MLANVSALVFVIPGAIVGLTAWITLFRWIESLVPWTMPSGGMLIIWDRLFGTFQPETSPPTYGLTHQSNSSHPLDVQFSQIRLLWRDLRTATSWRQCWQRLWNRPDWQPASI